jgi:hypothetical protein
VRTAKSRSGELKTTAGPCEPVWQEQGSWCANISGGHAAARTVRAARARATQQGVQGAEGARGSERSSLAEPVWCRAEGSQGVPCGKKRGFPPQHCPPEDASTRARSAHAAMCARARRTRRRGGTGGKRGAAGPKQGGAQTRRRRQTDRPHPHEIVPRRLCPAQPPEAPAARAARVPRARTLQRNAEGERGGRRVSGRGPPESSSSAPPSLLLFPPSRICICLPHSLP